MADTKIEEIAYRVPGNGWKRKTGTEAQLLKFIEKLQDEWGRWVEIRWAKD